MRNAHFQRVQKCTAGKRQRGITLLLVLVLLLITAAASVYFHNNMVGSTRLSGANRDNSASLLLAESAMEMLRGGFMNQLNSDVNDSPEAIGDSGCTKVTSAGETPVSYSLDNCEAYAVIHNLDDTTAVGEVLANLDYVFFVNDGELGGGITQQQPSILQRVSNGEAASLSPDSSRVANTHLIDADVDQMAINDLFSNAFKPFLYVTNANGLLTESNAASWTGEAAQEKAAAWLEFTRNADDDTAMDIWVEAVGQAGFARSYLQRYVGTYYPPTQIGGLAALIEASNIDRGN